jgi:nucleoid-associated protein YgaU
MGLGTGLRESTLGGGGSTADRGSSAGTTGGSATLSGSATSYTVVRGDVLTTIAKKHHVTLKALEAANPGVNPNRLLVNSKLNIPAPAAATGASTSGARAGGTSTTTPPASGARAATTRSSGATRTAGATAARTLAPGSTYTVKRGDTLRKIAKAAYGDENMWRRIARSNRADLPNPNLLTAGQTLRLPAR